MNEQWKKTLIRIFISLTMIGFSCQSVIPLTPWMFLGGVYVGLNAVCNLVPAIALSVRADARTHIPFSVTAVTIAVLLSLLAASELTSPEHNPFLDAGAIMMVLLFVPYLLIMAAAAYLKGKKQEALNCNGRA